MNRLHGFEGERWICYFWFVGWDCFSVGAHVCLGAPNIEIHLPFGFIRVGRKRKPMLGIVTLPGRSDEVAA